jgi:hypothetical protein
MEDTLDSHEGANAGDAGRLHHNVKAGELGKEASPLGGNDPAICQSSLGLAQIVSGGHPRGGNPGQAIRISDAGLLNVSHGHRPHTGKVRELADKPRTHLPGPDDANPNGRSLLLSLL